MLKKIILPTVLIFIAWTFMDFILHVIILKSQYETSLQLWRPMNEMKMGLMHFVTLITALGFVWIYAFLITEKTLAKGLKFGFWFGLTTGVSMGYGSYSVMPIPYLMALGWFLGTLVETMIAGSIVGRLIKST